jgi:threonine/homoserine/homoserine lactone efflux protein
MASALALGLLVGFPIAASPGPMFFLVLRRTLAGGRRSGFIAGLGIASGDAIYAALAAFGVAAVTNLLISQRRWIGLIGGIALIAIGLSTLVSNPLPNPPPEGEGELRAAKGDGVLRAANKGEGMLASMGLTYLSMVGLTLSNPPTILSFAAVFAGLGVHIDSAWTSRVGLVLGVMLGSALWWVLLTAFLTFWRRRFSSLVTRAIAVVAGVALVVFGALISLQSL